MFMNLRHAIYDIMQMYKVNCDIELLIHTAMLINELQRSIIKIKALLFVLEVMLLLIKNTKSDDYYMFQKVISQ